MKHIYIYFRNYSRIDKYINPLIIAVLMDNKLTELTDKDVEDVEREIKDEERFEVDDGGDRESESSGSGGFSEYDQETKPSFIGRMWNGIKNVFSSDDDEDEGDERTGSSKDNKANEEAGEENAADEDKGDKEDKEEWEDEEITHESSSSDMHGKEVLPQKPGGVKKSGYFNGLKDDDFRDRDFGQGSQAGQGSQIRQGSQFGQSGSGQSGREGSSRIADRTPVNLAVNLASVNMSADNRAKEKDRLVIGSLKQEDDMGNLIKISVGILERLPQNEFEKFKQTDDFVSYKEIIKKYKRSN